MKNSDLLNYSFSDGRIIDILIKEDDLYIKFENWKNDIIEFRFINCWKVVNYKAINCEIEEVVILNNSDDLLEIKKEILETGGYEYETSNIFHIVFISSWSEKVVLSIIAEKGEVEYSSKNY